VASVERSYSIGKIVSLVKMKNEERGKRDSLQQIFLAVVA
jgi:hypothetical protein